MGNHQFLRINGQLNFRLKIHLRSKIELRSKIHLSLKGFFDLRVFPENHQENEDQDHAAGEELKDEGGLT